MTISKFPDDQPRLAIDASDSTLHEIAARQLCRFGPLTRYPITRGFYREHLLEGLAAHRDYICREATRILQELPRERFLANLPQLPRPWNNQAYIAETLADIDPRLLTDTAIEDRYCQEFVDLVRCWAKRDASVISGLRLLAGNSTIAADGGLEFSFRLNLLQASLTTYRDLLAFYNKRAAEFCD